MISGRHASSLLPLQKQATSIHSNYMAQSFRGANLLLHNNIAWLTKMFQVSLDTVWTKTICCKTAQTVVVMHLLESLDSHPEGPKKAGNLLLTEG